MLAGASGHTLHHVESIADGTRTPPPRRVPRVVIIELVVVALITAAIGVYVLVRVRQHQEGLLIRPTGIPASVSTQTADLMTLSPVPVTSAPGFTLTDQTGHTLSLASLRGKVVVLEFMDPHCTDICPIVSQEFITAYGDLGRLASRVVFIAVNVNQYHLRVADVAAFSREQRLTTIPLMALPHRALPQPPRGMAGLQHRGRSTQPQRRHHPHLGDVLHQPPGP